MILDYFSIFLSSRLYKINSKKLNDLFDTMLKGNIVEFYQYSEKHDPKICYIEIIFNNGYGLLGWNMNRYYAWMSIGNIYYKSTETEKYEQKHSWVNGMPSRFLLYKLLRKIEKYHKDNDLEFNFTDPMEIINNLNR